VAVQFAISYIQHCDVFVGRKNGHQQFEVLRPNVIFRQVKFSNPIGVLEGEGKMFDTKTMVE